MAKLHRFNSLEFHDEPHGVNLAELKKVVFEFFDNVIVNEEDTILKKNRLELIQMLCKTFDNYVNFSLIDAL